MPDTTSTIEPERLGERLAALPGIERLRAAAADIPAYLVGGAVRDLLLGRDRADVDLVVEGDPEAIAGALGGEVRRHERFGTASVQADGLAVDLATARAESYPEPGALPEVRPATLSEDLARRDFSVNAMAVPLSGEPLLVDPFHGVEDLRHGLLRVLHGRSLEDDPTRALRAARYAARYGFTLEDATERQVRAASLDTVSRDRVEAELQKLAREERPRAGFELLHSWGLIELAPNAGERIEAVAEMAAAEPWAGLVDRTDAVLAAAFGRESDLAARLAGMSPGSPSGAVELARGVPPATLLVARVSGAEWLDRYVDKWRHVRLEIDGADLLAAGVAEGPAVGAGLAVAMRARLDGEVAGREQELAIALEAARNG